MKAKSKTDNKRSLPVGAKNLLVLGISGILAGFCNGLIGAGGGVVAVLALSSLIDSSEESRRSLYANALCVMLPLSLLTVFQYGLRGKLPTKALIDEFGLAFLGAIAGGLIGAVALGALKPKRLKRLFAALTVLSGILLLTR